MDELDAELAARLRATLDERGLRREDLARGMVDLGFRWTGNTVTQVITGRRGLSLLELGGVCEVLGQPISGLLDPNAKIQLPSGDTIGVAPVLLALAMRTGDWTEIRTAQAEIRAKQTQVERFMNLLDEEATSTAARRLDVTPAAVAMASQQLWGHSFATERDNRVGENPEEPEPEAPEARRALQARRGHASRALIDELRAYFAERQS